MQLSRIYSNRAAIFRPVDFNFGSDSDRLNVILGDVRRPKDKKRDSHNLGKTTLLHLIDFLMLKGLSSDHFLSKHPDRFAGFVFYLEIALNSGDYVTVRRGVTNPTRIALVRHAEFNKDFAESGDADWTHVDLSIDEAVKLLGSGPINGNGLP